MGGKLSHCHVTARTNMASDACKKAKHRTSFTDRYYCADREAVYEFVDLNLIECTK